MSGISFSFSANFLILSAVGTQPDCERSRTVIPSLLRYGQKFFILLPPATTQWVKTFALRTCGAGSLDSISSELVTEANSFCRRSRRVQRSSWDASQSIPLIFVWLELNLNLTWREIKFNLRENKFNWREIKFNWRESKCNWREKLNLTGVRVKFNWREIKFNWREKAKSVQLFGFHPILQFMCVHVCSSSTCTGGSHVDCGSLIYVDVPNSY